MYYSKCISFLLRKEAYDIIHEIIKNNPNKYLNISDFIRKAIAYYLHHFHKYKKDLVIKLVFGYWDDEI